MTREFRGKVDFVYVIITKEGPIKIGFTTDPYTRVKKICSDKSYQLKKCYLKPLKEGYGLIYERRMHQQLDYSQIEGEWFNTTEDKILKAFENADWYFNNLEKKNMNLEQNKDNLLNFLNNEKKFLTV